MGSMEIGVLSMGYLWNIYGYLWNKVFFEGSFLDDSDGSHTGSRQSHCRRERQKGTSGSSPTLPTM